MCKFKVRDTVTLGSDSQRMIVTDFRQTQGIWFCTCQWFVNGIPFEREFPEDSFTLV